ncbi:uncharacterized protein LY89DRAFT_686933 [Mollisia scopiformis]|uniref:Phosphoribulokinase/uridine kinase domain-containing protein n=1 Tax=Mollisia scopiformis TaxID=149040 RepID=A0A194X2Q0_MOLSC|nr:uncharacterized protein LY89DRAFT_686933 [Mollisia scopiformis]KUJ14461.1 hypothetical protein LY89DRAFT_686933 [Mollisia scopiformis]
MPHTSLEQDTIVGVMAPPNSPLGGAMPSTDNLAGLSLAALEIGEEKKPVLVVGISGCTSSGKSLLASLLAQVFGGSVLMHQDSYFQPKALCPFTTFRNTKEDLPFMFKTMTNNETGEYFITSDGYATTNYHVTGPDTDCDQAIDFMSMLGMITRVIGTGILPDQIEPPGDPGLLLGHDSNPTAEFIKHSHDLSSYESLIQELRIHVSKKVRHHAASNIRNNQLGKYIQSPAMNGYAHGSIDLVDVTKMLPVICFIEGFLLFTDPTKPQTVAPIFDLDTEQRALHIQYQTIADLTHELAVTEPNDPFSVEAREEIEQEIWDKNLEAKTRMQAVMGLKLFLPTGKETAMERRFARSEYRDWPEGERAPGQMWKTGGYFESVAWKNFQRTHGWMARGDVVEDEKCGFVEEECMGVCVRPKLDAGIEETLRWAVEAVLCRLCREDVEPETEMEVSDIEEI